MGETGASQGREKSSLSTLDVNTRGVAGDRLFAIRDTNGKSALRVVRFKMLPTYCSISCHVILRCDVKDLMPARWRLHGGSRGPYIVVVHTCRGGQNTLYVKVIRVTISTCEPQPLSLPGFVPLSRAALRLSATRMLGGRLAPAFPGTIAVMTLRLVPRTCGHFFRGSMPFGSFLPKEYSFFDFFEQHASKCVEGTQALLHMLRDVRAAAEYARSSKTSSMPGIRLRITPSKPSIRPLLPRSIVTRSISSSPAWMTSWISSMPPASASSCMTSRT